MFSDLDLRSRKVTKHPLPCTQKQSVGKLVKRREITEYMKMDLLGKVHNIQLDSVMIMYGLCKTTSN